MNKQELIEQIANEAGLSKSAAGKALEATTSAITAALKANDPVTLVGFGTFKVANRDARIGRNPATGGELKIPARKAPVFNAGKGLKEALN